MRRHAAPRPVLRPLAKPARTGLKAR
jgi:hypothetical protein